VNVRSASEQNLVYSGDNKQIAFVYKQADRVLLVIRDVATQKLHQLAIVGEPQAAPVWSPNNQKIAVLIKDNGELAVATVNVATRAQLIWRPAQAQASFDGFVWSPDSSSIILHSFTDSPILPLSPEPPRFIAQMAIDFSLTQAR
jgi:Tol biopolymer transport system component